MVLASQVRVAIARKALEIGLLNQTEVKDWALAKYANDPAISKSKNPEKLVADVVRISGGAAERELNLSAFVQALATYKQEGEAQAVEAERAEKAKMSKDLQAERELRNQDQREKNAHVIQTLSLIHM